MFYGLHYYYRLNKEQEDKLIELKLTSKDGQLFGLHIESAGGRAAREPRRTTRNA